MTIKELKNYFEDTANLKFYLTDVFSWRGAYDEVAFTPSKQGSRKESLALIERALTEVFQGWKGGHYVYDETTEVHFEREPGIYSEGALYSVLLFDEDLEKEDNKTREELIEKAAKKYCQDNISNLPQMHLTISTAFEAGADWYDRQFTWDLIVKVWNLATKTALAQVNHERAEFNSEEEIYNYIKQALDYDIPERNG